MCMIYNKYVCFLSIFAKSICCFLVIFFSYSIIADIALFPEMWSSGYTFPHNKEWLEQNSISLNSKYVKQFSEISLKLNMAIAITLLEKHEPKPRNTVCLFDRHGKLVYCYSKVHICETDETEKYYW